MIHCAYPRREQFSHSPARHVQEVGLGVVGLNNYYYIVIGTFLHYARDMLRLYQENQQNHAQKTPPWGPGPALGGCSGWGFAGFLCISMYSSALEAIPMPILVDIATLPKLVQFSDYA